MKAKEEEGGGPCRWRRKRLKTWTNTQRCLSGRRGGERGTGRSCSGKKGRGHFLVICKNAQEGDAFLGEEKKERRFRRALRSSGTEKKRDQGVITSSIVGGKGKDDDGASALYGGSLGEKGKTEKDGHLVYRGKGRDAGGGGKPKGQPLFPVRALEKGKHQTNGTRRHQQEGKRELTTPRVTRRKKKR